MPKTFQEYLQKLNLSESTISSYLWTVDYFTTHYKIISYDTLRAYRCHLLETFKPATINLRIQAINKYLIFVKKTDLILKQVKVQQKIFLDNVITFEDYLKLKHGLKRNSNLFGYFLVWFLGATGARISELVQLNVEHIEAGFADLYTKGSKLRRIYIPKKLQPESISWLHKIGIFSGAIFRNRFGNRMTMRGISMKLKEYACKYGVATNLVYPHSFRHLFARNFLQKCNDISILADLLGHEKIETTRIYLRRTGREQRYLIDSIIVW